MKIRCDLHVNGGHRRLVLVPQEHETLEHIALKLTAYVLFWDWEPSIELSLKHPALLGQEFKPDLVALDEAGGIRLWVECGKVALHKLDKLTRRYPSAKLVVLKASPEEGRRLREDVKDKLDRHALLEIWCWSKADFAAWSSALRPDVFVGGEALGRSLNLVINDTPLAADLAPA